MPVAAADPQLPPCMAVPRSLGLGAKYLPHHKNVQFVAALDGKLRRRLERSRNDKGTDDDAGDKKRGGAQRGAFGGKGGQTSGRIGAFSLATRAGSRHDAGPGDDVGNSSGSDSDEGKSRAFKRSARRIITEAAEHPVSCLSRPAAEKRASVEASAGASGAVVNGHTMSNSTAQFSGGMTAKQKQQMLLFAPVQADVKAQGKKKKKKSMSIDATRAVQGGGCVVMEVQSQPAKGHGLSLTF
eukprot:366556-Chlamydomonas_euryale.AAC.5